ILRSPAADHVISTEHTLGTDVPLLGSLGEPFDSLRVVLLRSVTHGVMPTNLKLGHGIALVSQSTPLLHRCWRICRLSYYSLSRSLGSWSGRSHKSAARNPGNEHVGNSDEQQRGQRGEDNFGAGELALPERTSLRQNNSLCLSADIERTADCVANNLGKTL